MASLHDLPTRKRRVLTPEEIEQRKLKVFQRVLNTFKSGQLKASMEMKQAASHLEPQHHT